MTKISTNVTEQFVKTNFKPIKVMTDFQSIQTSGVYKNKITDLLCIFCTEVISSLIPIASV